MNDRRTYRRYVYAAPALIVATFLAIVVILLLAGTAGAHNTNYCGHAATYWNVWSYGQQIHYRERFDYGYNSGGHRHIVKTQYAVGTVWLTIHEHDRSCPVPV